jgi:hypothetical protein
MLLPQAKNMFHLKYIPMKNFQQKLKRWPVIAGMACMMVFMLSSCLKNHNDNTPAQPVAALAVIDASPGTTALDFYLNTDRVTASPLTPGTFLTYFTAYAGNRTASFNQAGTSTVAAHDSVTLVANKYYSLFLANTLTTPDLILARDSISKPASGTISVRLVNASPDAGPIDLLVKSTATKLVQSEPYKGVSSFAGATIGLSDTLQVVKAGTSTVLAIVPTAKLTTNSVYTVWLYGFANTTDASQKLAAGVMANAYFY